MNGLVDKKDKQILYELDLNSRQTNKEIAKKVRLSEQVVGNRIKRLIDLNVIEYFYIKTNPTLLGYIHTKIYLRFHNMPKEKEDELIHELRNKNNILWTASLRGKYDVVVSLYIKSISEFTQAYESLFGHWGSYILERNVILLEKAVSFTRAYLSEKKEPEQITYTEENKKTAKLDKTDEAILRILNKDARKQLVDIAKELKVSPDTIRYRIKNLKKVGVLTGFGVKINFDKIKVAYSIIQIKLQNMNHEKYRKLETLAKINKNIVVFIKTIGDHDIELETETSNKQELDEIIKLLRDNFVSEIKNYELLEVTKEHRLTYYPF